MEGQTLIYNNNPCRTPPTLLYASYHTPPYTFNYPNTNINTNSWSEYTYHSLSMCEDVIQMQHQQLRFPTPPITPPRSFNSAAEPQEQHHLQQATIEEYQSHQSNNTQEEENLHKSCVPLRTQSVIMKVGHDQSPHQLTADLSPYSASHLLTTTEDNGDTLLSHHQHQHHHHDTPSSGTSSPSSSNDFVCDWIDCGRYFESLEHLAIHVTQIHAVASLADGLYYCRWSGCQRTERGFNARYKMLVHVRTHTKEKPHQCHLCDKRFSRAENLKIHIRSHSGEKPYICTFEGCNKAYSNSSDRFKHTRTHSMEKPYLCKVPGCQKRYTDPSSLRKHVKTFKHALQIMDSKTSHTVATTTTTTPPPYLHQYHQQELQNSLDESRFSPPEQTENTIYPSYHLIMTATPNITVPTQDTFCMAMEEMCHIRATLDSYKSSSTTPSDTDNYWLHDNADSAYTSPITRNNEITMDLSTEKPLDLRVKRC